MPLISKTYSAQNVRFAFYRFYHQLAIYEICRSDGTAFRDIQSSWKLRNINDDSPYSIEIISDGTTLTITDVTIDQQTGQRIDYDKDVIYVIKKDYDFNSIGSSDCWFDGENLIVGTGDIRDLPHGGASVDIFNLSFNNKVTITCTAPNEIKIYSKGQYLQKNITISKAENE